MAFDTLDGGRVEQRELAEEMRASYLDYAMSVIVGRARCPTCGTGSSRCTGGCCSR